MACRVGQHRRPANSNANVLTAYPGTNFQQINVPKSWGPTNQVKVSLRNPWVAPETFEVKDIDGGWFHPYLVIPATEVQATLDGADFTNDSTADEWEEPVDGGDFSVLTIKDIDGGFFDPNHVIPATYTQAILGGGDFENDTTQDEWPDPVDGGAFV